MKTILTLLGALLLAGCQCSGTPTITLRNPFQLDAEPATTAGPRLMAVPQYYAPQYAPQLAPRLPAGFTAPGDPCK